MIYFSRLDRYTNTNWNLIPCSILEALSPKSSPTYYSQQFLFLYYLLSLLARLVDFAIITFFYFSQSHTSRIFTFFSLVYSTICGPSLITIYTGFFYFLNFIDDHSRMCWFYLSKARSCALDALKAFYERIKISLVSLLKFCTL